jgi:hypothetical protein
VAENQRDSRSREARFSRPVEQDIQMNMPQSNRRKAILLLIPVFLFLGYAVNHLRHPPRGHHQLAQAKSLVSAAFRESPPGFKQGIVPWVDKSGKKFDLTYFDAWQLEMNAKRRIHGMRMAAYFYPIDYRREDTPEQRHHRIQFSIVRTPEQLKQDMLSHFGDPLKSLGFVISSDGPIDEASHGHRTVVTFSYPNTDVEVDMKFVFGRGDCTFVDIALGRE